MPSPTIVTAENLTVGSFKGRFMKFVLPSPTSTAETLSPASGANDHADIGLYFLSQDDYLAKRHSIEECLRGSNDDDDRVDLWQLRELALSPGGLLEPGLRKRAWPLLTRALDRGAAGADPSSPNSSAAAPPSPTDLAALHRDVQYTVWNVREHFEQQQQLRQQHHSGAPNHKSSDSTSTGSSTTRHVSFAPELLAKHKSDHDEQQEQDSTVPHSVSVDESETLWSRGSCSLASSRRSGRNRKASKLEQQIVANAVTSCLRTTAPEESEAFEDDRFHYFSGLHDLTALLMVNLESPSLSSLIL